MNKITRPKCNDNEVLSLLANNHRVHSYPKLLNALQEILRCYQQYIKACGNPFNFVAVTISSEVEDILRSHYKRPTKELKHISILRKNTEHLTCPMCGSLHSGTLDHIFPSSQYAMFAIFSLNLVPACKCNSIRQDLMIGMNAKERVLHPYFDKCLSERLVVASFEDLGSVPLIKLRLCVDNTHPEFNAIAFHVKGIVERTGIINYLLAQWVKLCRKPSLVVRSLKDNPSSIFELRKILNEELQTLDETHQGKNNWNSIFVAGLLDEKVLSWLMQQILKAGRLPNGALISPI